MCTMTWMFDDEGYVLFFNRDEARSRLTALPPEIRVVNGVSFITPIDADAGGTWMGVNQFGLSVCILNGMSKVPLEQRDFTSRGLLVMSVLDCADQAMVFERVQSMDVVAYRPFSLVVLLPGTGVACLTWDGVSVSLKKEVVCPLISSSFRQDEVATHRKQLFDGLGSVNAKLLSDFHRSHLPQKGPFSVCMHREDAKTVSLSRVVVTTKQADFYYAPGSPCETDFLPPVSLARTPTVLRGSP